MNPRDMNCSFGTQVAEVRSRVVALRDDIDWLIASYLNEELTANLYSARLHVMRCIKELQGVSA